MNYWSLTASSKRRVVHGLGISYHWIYREPTLMRSCRPNLFTNWGESVDLGFKKLTSRYWQNFPASTRAEQKVRLCVCDCVCLGLREGNTHQTLKNVWRTQAFSFSTQRKKANGSQNARGKHSSNSVRAKGADQRESCLQFRPTRQFFPRLPGERAQREINLRYQFAEFCSIDGREPRDFSPSAQEPGPVNKIT